MMRADKEKTAAIAAAGWGTTPAPDFGAAFGRAA